MESGHVRRPQAARSTGRPQYHGGRRGMRDEENEEWTRGREDSNSGTEGRVDKDKDGMEERKEDVKIMAKSGAPKRCVCVCCVFVFKLWVVAKLGTMNRGDRGLGG